MSSLETILETICVLTYSEDYFDVLLTTQMDAYGLTQKKNGYLRD